MKFTRTSPPCRAGVLRRVVHSLALLWCAVLLVPALQAQANLGTISGRVFNPATGEYMRNAEVRIEGTNLTTYTGDSGYFQLRNVPPGEVQVSVTYTGYAKSTKTINVMPGANVEENFDLLGSTSRSDGDVVKLNEFVVSSEREGSAKAIMDQRAAVNAKNVIAADNFGEITMGNPGEFMKYMPGIVLDYVEPDARGARIGGLDPKYGAVTLDGNRMASGASASFSADSRSFEFEQASMDNVEAVEVNKTLIPSMDADSPAGAINMRSKMAFDRKGRVLDVLVSSTMNGNFGRTLAKTQGPGNKKQRKIFPGGKIDYSDVFFGGKLGIQSTISDQTEFTQETRSQTNYSYGVAGKPNPYVANLVFRPGEKISHRFAANLNADLKATDDLVLSLRTAFSHFDGEFNNRRIDIIASPAQITPDSTVNHIVALATNNANTRLRTAYSHRLKSNESVMIAPRAEYKLGPWEMAAGGSYSRSLVWYDDMNKGFFQRADTQVTRISWQADRPDENSAEWTVKQLSGPDWSDPASYLISDVLNNNVSSTARSATNQQFLGYADMKRDFGGDHPFSVKVGVRSRLSTYTTNGGTRNWTYLGPTGNQLTSQQTSPLPADPSYHYEVHQGGNIDSLNLYVPDTVGVYQLYVAHPDWFKEDTVGNLTRRYDEDHSLKEEIDAGYFEFSSQIDRLRYIVGARYEKTRTKASVYEIRPDSDVVAAGYTPNTVEFVNYKYNNGVKTPRYGEYGNFFLSGNAKYEITRKLLAQAGFSQSIYRPDYPNLAGAVSINETTQVITIPNPNLKPELSDKALASLQYYIEPAGMIGLTVARTWVKDKVGPRVALTAAEAGYANDPVYSGYDFLTVMNNGGTVKIDTIDLEYRQQLTFLPGPLGGLSVFGNFSRVISHSGAQLNLVPKSFNGGIGYRSRKFEMNLRATWTAARVFNMFEGTSNDRWEWHEDRLMFDLSANYKFTPKLSLILAGRNIFNEPDLQYSNVFGRRITKENYGALWTTGLKYRF